LLAILQGGGRIANISRTFGVDWPHLGAQIISFCIVCAVLYRWAYQPVLQILESRRQQIAQSLENTEKIKAELATTQSLRQDVLRKANDQAARIIEDARTAAARVQERESQKAIVEAQHIIAKSQEAAVLERDRMLADLKREIGRLVVQTTANVTGKILTAEDQRRLAEETAKQLPS